MATVGTTHPSTGAAPSSELNQSKRLSNASDQAHAHDNAHDGHTRGHHGHEHAQKHAPRFPKFQKHKGSESEGESVHGGAHTPSHHGHHSASHGTHTPRRHDLANDNASEASNGDPEKKKHGLAILKKKKEGRASDADSASETGGKASSEHGSDLEAHHSKKHSGLLHHHHDNKEKPLRHHLLGDKHHKHGEEGHASGADDASEVSHPTTADDNHSEASASTTSSHAHHHKLGHKHQIARPPAPEILNTPEYDTTLVPFPEDCTLVCATFIVLQDGIRFQLHELACAAHFLMELGESSTDHQYHEFFKWYHEFTLLMNTHMDLLDDNIIPALRIKYHDVFDAKALSDHVTLMLQMNTLGNFKLQIGKHRNKKLGEHIYQYIIDLVKQTLVFFQDHERVLVPMFNSVMKTHDAMELNHEIMHKLTETKHTDVLVLCLQCLVKEDRKEFVHQNMKSGERLKYNMAALALEHKFLTTVNQIYHVKDEHSPSVHGHHHGEHTPGKHSGRTSNASEAVSRPSNGEDAAARGSASEKGDLTSHHSHTSGHDSHGHKGGEGNEHHGLFHHKDHSGAEGGHPKEHEHHGLFHHKDHSGAEGEHPKEHEHHGLFHHKDHAGAEGEHPKEHEHHGLFHHKEGHAEGDHAHDSHSHGNHGHHDKETVNNSKHS